MHQVLGVLVLIRGEEEEPVGLGRPIGPVGLIGVDEEAEWLLFLSRIQPLDDAPLHLRGALVLLLFRIGLEELEVREASIEPDDFRHVRIAGEAGGGVVMPRQDLREGGELGGQAFEPDVRSVRGRVFARMHRGVGGHAPGAGRDMLLEDQALRGERVQMRRGVLLVPIGAQV